VGRREADGRGGQGFDRSAKDSSFQGFLLFGGATLRTRSEDEMRAA